LSAHSPYRVSIHSRSNGIQLAGGRFFRSLHQSLSGFVAGKFRLNPIDTLAKYKKGDTVTCNVVAVQENGLEVKTVDGELTAFIKRSDLSRDRSEQRPERFNVGDKIDAFVTSADKAARRLSLSIKALEIAEEKQAVAQYGSSDSGASLGDIFKAAIRKRENDGADDEKTDDKE